MRSLTYKANLVFSSIKNSLVPISAKEISIKINTDAFTVRSYIRTMIKHKEIYVSEWRRELNHITPMYSVGDNESVKKPKAYSRIEIIKRYRRKNPIKVNLTQRKRYAKLKGLPIINEIPLNWLTNFIRPKNYALSKKEQ